MKDRSGGLRRYAKLDANSWVRDSLGFVVLSFCALTLAAAQQAAPSSTQKPAATPPPATAAAIPDTAKPPAPQTPQQKQLADDTEKLLVLANELKAEMDKSTKDTLSLSVIKKAEAVEKLARKVRDEMKTLQN
jgi:hypothetical protein